LPRTEDTAPELHYAFRGLALSLLTRKERSLWGLIVFAFPQDKASFFEKHRTQKKRFTFARSLRVFPSLTWFWQQYLYLTFAIMMVVWSGGPLTPAGIARV